MSVLALYLLAAMHVWSPVGPSLHRGARDHLVEALVRR